MLLEAKQNQILNLIVKHIPNIKQAESECKMSLKANLLPSGSNKVYK